MFNPPESAPDIRTQYDRFKAIDDAIGVSGGGTGVPVILHHRHLFSTDELNRLLPVVDSLHPDRIGVTVASVARAAAIPYLVSRDRRSHGVPVTAWNPQKRTSAKTSRPQIPGLHRKMVDVLGPVNLDLGGGKYELATEFLAKHGILNLVLDPYNRSDAHNQRVRDYLIANGGPDSITVANVLNVIDAEDARADVVESAAAWSRGGPVYFTTYEGDQSGVGKETSDGWQENRATSDYLREVEPYFDYVEILPGTGGVILAEGAG